MTDEEKTGELTARCLEIAKYNETVIRAQIPFLCIGIARNQGIPRLESIMHDVEEAIKQKLVINPSTAILNQLRASLKGNYEPIIN